MTSSCNNSARSRALRYPISTYAVLGLLLLISAFLMSVALVSPNYPWLSFTTLIPLFVAIRLLGPAQAGLAGGFWGLGIALFSRTFGDSPITPSMLSFLVLGAAPAAYAYAAARLTRRFGYNPLVLGLGWLVVELSLSPVGLRTGLLAGSQHEGLFMSTVGQSLGYLLVAYLVAFANGLILAVVADLPLHASGATLPTRTRDQGKSLKFAAECVNRLMVPSPLQPRAPPASLVIEPYV